MSRVHRTYMERALRRATEGAAAGEVPVGAVVVRGGVIVGEGHNRVLERGPATAHAEMVALAAAAAETGDERLTGCTLYVTLEPCPMCAFAAILSRVERIVFGASDPKFGGCGSVVNLPAEPAFNHRPEVIGGIMEGECAELLRDFFQNRRRT